MENSYKVLLLYFKKKERETKCSEEQNLVKFTPNNDAKDWKGEEEDS